MTSVLVFVVWWFTPLIGRVLQRPRFSNKRGFMYGERSEPGLLET